MKKLMIAAAVAACGMGAIAAESACAPVTQTKDTAWVYQWKFSGKTTHGNKAAVVNTSSCAPGGEKCTYRVKTSLKIQGYTMVCNPAVCADDALGFETQFVEENEVFWMTKPWKAEMAGGVTTDVAHIIGKKKKQVEIGGVASLTEVAENSTYTLTYAGFGKYDLKNRRVKSASGNFAGFLSQPWAYNLKKDLCILAGYWDCTTLQLVCEGPSIAYGKWSTKFKKSASKKYVNGKLPKMPNWVVGVNAL